ncbi:bacillopeptidase F [Oceanobacillus limi]|uniref:Bacillopeptidase F n=1 Tax=Oceanobacillus limi TaxID=930131 RepID=A0A1I0A297_9BACI|nr:hypothetical protein [Oceanobacillus limi]SES87771.1 bacillopeptidase F [Oceanobacillus limi]
MKSNNHIFQRQVGDYAPGLASDENGASAESTYIYAAGEFEQLTAEEGNLMIRARIAQPVDGMVTKRM